MPEPRIVQPKRNTPLLPPTLKNLFFPPEEDQYRYFARAAEFPFATGSDLIKAAWAADASMLCYARYGADRMTDDQLKANLAQGGLALTAQIGEDPLDWNAPGTQAYFAEGDGFAVLAYRGTEIDDPADEHADLDILLLHEPDYKGGLAPPLGHLAIFEHLLSIPCLVHQGFQRALNAVWPDVFQLLGAYRAAHPQAEICIAGHSLGGALAVLTYSRCADPNISAYTIGCPRVGNTKFRERVAANPGKGHFRFVNFKDLVTHVPLESAFYLHTPGSCYRFDNTGNLDCEDDGTALADIAVLAATIEGLPADIRSKTDLLDRLPAPPGAVDHSPARYCMRLWDCI
jgi:hypothetical protein